MAEMTFDDLVLQSTGRHVISFNEDDLWHRETLSLLAQVADQVLESLNAPDSPIRQRRRINEVSRHFEDALQKTLDRHPD